MEYVYIAVAAAIVVACTLLLCLKPFGFDCFRRWLPKTPNVNDLIEGTEKLLPKSGLLPTLQTEDGLAVATDGVTKALSPLKKFASDMSNRLNEESTADPFNLSAEGVSDALNTTAAPTKVIIMTTKNCIMGESDDPEPSEQDKLLPKEHTFTKDEPATNRTEEEDDISMRVIVHEHALIKPHLTEDEPATNGTEDDGVSRRVLEKVLHKEELAHGLLDAKASTDSS